ncbi:MAG TPA: YcxB family protein [Candidatus Sulfotelmatobacter sp.]|nr:YcxB family protein [Candidatus Sulfotelmatobacter sp.]
MLQLEYAVTDAEMREAKSLDLRRYLGKGSRTRTLLLLFTFFGALLTLAYFQVRTVVLPKYQPLALAGFVALVCFLYYLQIRKRERTRKATKIEITEREINFNNEASRFSMLWSGFSQCMESPNLFVLLDQPKGRFFIFPKRAFPDENAQNWFRILANQQRAPSASTADQPFLPHAVPSTGGITLDFQLGYCDCLNRMVTSWRTRGLVLLVYLTLAGTSIFTLAYPIPNAVVSPAKVLFLYALPAFTAMLAVVLPLFAFFQWRTWAKYSGMRRIVLNKEQIGFVGQDRNGSIPWTAFQCYLENRWSFFVWHPKTRQWDMFPKRAIASAVELDQCRALLQQKLRRSAWFFH